MSSSVDGSGDINKQQQSTKWTSRPTSISMIPNTKPPRMVDRELQRIKSLAMVSVISRSFTQEPQSITIVNSAPSPTPSVVSSTSHHNHHRLATMSSFSDMRLATSSRSHRSNSVSSHHSRGGGGAAGYVRSPRSHRRLKQAELDEIERELVAMFEDAFRIQHQDRVEHWVSTVALPPPSDSFSVLSTAPEDQQQPSNPALDNVDPTAASCANRLRRDSVISTDVFSIKDHQQQRIKELEHRCASALKRLEHAERQHAQWAKHIQEVVSTQLAEKEAEANKARQLAELVVYQERMMAEMQRNLDRRDDIQELYRTREALGQLGGEIDILTDTKADIQHTMNRVQLEQDASQHVLMRTQAILREVSAEVEIQHVHIEEKIDTMKRQLEEKETEVAMAKAEVSQRMSMINTSMPTMARSGGGGGSGGGQDQGQGQGPHNSRYTGGPLPPPAVPPTDPLPSVPASPATSTIKPASIYSSSSIFTPDNASTVVFDNHRSERAYREFTEQLQTRLSVSKEIDNLQLWQSEDLEEFERRMHEKFKDIDDDKRQSFIQSLGSKEGAAFWRGMKKKLRV